MPSRRECSLEAAHVRPEGVGGRLGGAGVEGVELLGDGKVCAGDGATLGVGPRASMHSASMPIVVAALSSAAKPHEPEPRAAEHRSEDVHAGVHAPGR